MTILRYESGPNKLMLVHNRRRIEVEPKKSMRFDFEMPRITIGSHAENTIQLLGPSLHPKHAVIFRKSGREHVIEKASDAADIVVSGEYLLPGDRRSLHSGDELTLGEYLFLFLEESQVRSHPQPSDGAWTGSSKTLYEWWETAQPLTKQLYPALFSAARDGGGSTALLRNLMSGKLAWQWLLKYRSDPRASFLPMSLLQLVDLSSLILFSTPPLRTFSRRQRKLGGQMLLTQYGEAYIHHFLRRLQHAPGTSFVRHRICSRRSDIQSKADITCRFVGDINNWIADIWLDQDCGGNEDQVTELRWAMAQEQRVIADVNLLMQYLVDMAQVTSRSTTMGGDRGRTRALQPLEEVERLILGARAQVPQAFSEPDTILISGCLQSRPLDTRQVKPAPVDVQPTSPRVPTRNSGNYASIRRTRVTQRIEELPEVIPSELAKIRSKGGKHLFIEQLLNDGLQRFERESFDVEVQRKTYLLCFVADVGPNAQYAGLGLGANIAGGDIHAEDVDAGHTLETPVKHAKRLIYESIRDLPDYVPSQEIELDLALFLRDDSRAGKNTSHILSLNDIRHSFGRTQYDDIVELEDRAPGWFFGGRRATSTQVSFEYYIQEALTSGRYSMIMNVFMGPAVTLRDLIPWEVFIERDSPGLRSVFKLVQLGQFHASVEAATGVSVDEVMAVPRFQMMTDRDLRYSIIADLLGNFAGATTLVEQIGFESFGP